MSNLLRFGKTSINLDAVKDMTREDFMSSHASSDFDKEAAWHAIETANKGEKSVKLVPNGTNKELSGKGKRPEGK